jgi:hypothetical protein
VVPSMTAAAAEGSKYILFPQAVMGAPPGANVWSAMTKLPSRFADISLEPIDGSRGWLGVGSASPWPPVMMRGGEASLVSSSAGDFPASAFPSSSPASGDSPPTAVESGRLFMLDARSRSADRDLEVGRGPGGGCVSAVVGRGKFSRGGLSVGTDIHPAVGVTVGAMMGFPGPALVTVGACLAGAFS